MADSLPAAGGADPASIPEGICSLLDTDLYKLTMQCCVLKYFPNVDVRYNFTNRTPHMKFTRKSVAWLQKQIDKLANLKLSEDELAFLKESCPYLTPEYLSYLQTFTLRPAEQVYLTFTPDDDSANTSPQDSDIGAIELHTAGLWLETILYEIPLLALISETYFRFIDRDWSHDGQYDNVVSKGRKLLAAGCAFSEFGSRRRRDYRTQETVLRGLLAARDEATREGWTGKLAGTSNVHFAMRFGLSPVGTVAHEWFMGIAAITDDYENANEIALRYWVGTFGAGVLSIALTDTFGTRSFLGAFAKPITLPSSTSSSSPQQQQPTDTSTPDAETYAQSFVGVRQDSGDPREFVKLMRSFYDEQGISEKKTVVFSDSLDVDKCIEYKAASESEGFVASFGVGTFLTNDYTTLSTGAKSVPLNIVIKIGAAAGNPAVKISDNAGKNTGAAEKVAEVKQRLGYREQEWEGGDERVRWGRG